MNKPKWNGNESSVEITGCVMAMHPSLGPILVQMDDCDDYFLPIFSEVEDLHTHVQYLQQLGLGTFIYSVKKIDDPDDFLDSLNDVGVRIMLNPQVVSDNHTKWQEVIRDGEQWKFESNESI